MRAYERGLARIWPAAHRLKLGGVLGMAVMTLPGLRLDFWSSGDEAARRKLHEAALADLPENWLTRPARAELLYALGQLAARLGEPAKAVDYTQQGLLLAQKLRRRADIAHFQFRLGWLLCQQGRLEEALTAFRQTLEAWPRYHGAHTWLGYTFGGLGRYEEALAAFQQAIELYPDDVGPHLGVGRAYTDMGRHEDAVVAFQWATEAAPADVRAWHSLGEALRRLKRYPEAEAAIRRAVKLDPREPDSYRLLGDLYASQSQAPQALAAYEQAVDRQTDPHEKAVLRLREGGAQQRMGRYQAAIDTYRQASDAWPELMPAYLETGACLRRLGRGAEAVGPLQSARQLIAKDDAYNLACLESVCGNTEAALNWLKTAVEREPHRRSQALADPDFDFIRQAEGFEGLVGQA